MMTAQDRQKLEQLRNQVRCHKAFICFQSALADLCRGVYHRDIDVLECLEKQGTACPFARPFGCTTVCTCAVRRFIAQNIDQWSAESTAILKPG